MTINLFFFTSGANPNSQTTQTNELLQKEKERLCARNFAKVAARKQAIDCLQRKHSEFATKHKKAQELKVQKKLNTQLQPQKYNNTNVHIQKTNPFEEDLGVNSNPFEEDLGMNSNPFDADLGVSSNPFDEDMGHCGSSDNGNPFLEDIRADDSSQESKNNTGIFYVI